MKKGAEIAAEILASPEDHKRRATTLRRLAGGIRAEIRSDILDEKEVRVLTEACAVLERMATERGKAKGIAARKQDEEARRRKVIETLIAGNFGGLSGVPEKVAFIAAAAPHTLRGGHIRTAADLSFYLNEEIGMLVFSLARRDGDPAALVAAAWEKFTGARAELEAKHSALIHALAAK